MVAVPPALPASQVSVADRCMLGSQLTYALPWQKEVSMEAAPMTDDNPTAAAAGLPNGLPNGQPGGPATPASTPAFGFSAAPTSQPFTFGAPGAPTLICAVP